MARYYNWYFYHSTNFWSFIKIVELNIIESGGGYDGTTGDIGISFSRNMTISKKGWGGFTFVVDGEKLSEIVKKGTQSQSYDWAYNADKKVEYPDPQFEEIVRIPVIKNFNKYVKSIHIDIEVANLSFYYIFWIYSYFRRVCGKLNNIILRRDSLIYLLELSEKCDCVNEFRSISKICNSFEKMTDRDMHIEYKYEKKDENNHYYINKLVFEKWIKMIIKHYCKNVIVLITFKA